MTGGRVVDVQRSQEIEKQHGVFDLADVFCSGADQWQQLAALPEHLRQAFKVAAPDPGRSITTARQRMQGGQHPFRVNASACGVAYRYPAVCRIQRVAITKDVHRHRGDVFMQALGHHAR